MDKFKYRDEGKKIINTFGSLYLCFTINRICVPLLTRFHCKLRNYHNLNRIATIILYSTITWRILIDMPMTAIHPSRDINFNNQFNNILIVSVHR